MTYSPILCFPTPITPVLEKWLLLDPVGTGKPPEASSEQGSVCFLIPGNTAVAPIRLLGFALAIEQALMP